MRIRIVAETALTCMSKLVFTHAGLIADENEFPLISSSILIQGQHH